MASRVLLLDEDAACLAAHAEVMQGLGYSFVTASDPIEALQRIEADPTIGVVVTDLTMRAMNGIAFLEEVDARFALLRPVVPIVVTAEATLEAAVQAMNANAVDFLAKPAAGDALARAMRRAFLRRSQLANRRVLAALVQAQPASEPAPPAEPAKLRCEELSAEEQLIRVVRRTKRFRQRRNEFLGSELFADPAWDIILELTLAKIQGEPVPVSSACAAATVPFTTAYRHVGNLVDHRMVRRWKDPLDQRRVLLELEDETHAVMSEFLLTSGLIDRPL